MTKKSKIWGFTLIELLVVMAILGILATVGLGSFRSSQIKGRDGKRKLDLGNLQKALEMYQNDFGRYPVSDGTADELPDWGQEFNNPNSPTTIYMKELPKDPSSTQNYFYFSSDGIWYKLYAKLENGNDYCFNDANVCLLAGYSGTDCGSGSLCNYVVTSSNVRP